MRYETPNKVAFHFKDLSSIANHQVSEVNESRWAEVVRDERDKSWLGVDNRAQLREIVELRGWQDGVDKGLEALSHLKAPKLPTYKRKRCHRSTGHTINLQRMYSGRENFWRSSFKEQTDNKLARKGHVTIFIDICASSMKNSESFFWRGALGCVWAKALLESGRKVRILCGFRTKNTLNGKGAEKDIVCSIECKHYMQPLDLHNVFSMTALSGFFRHYGFKVLLGAGYPVNDSLGQHIHVKEEDIEELLDDAPCIFIEDIWSQREAERKAESFLKEMGV